MKRLIKNLIVILAFIAIFIIIMFVRIGTVISTSMVPTLHVGQTIVYLNGNINGASKGDIIIYKDTSGANVIHRVVRVEYLLENNIIHRVLHVKGDNNLLEDNEPITENNYIGKAIYAIKSDAINSFIEHYNSLSFPARIALFAIFISPRLFKDKIIDSKIISKLLLLWRESSSTNILIIIL